MTDFEVDKTSGKGTATVRVHPLSVNDTGVDREATIVVNVDGTTRTVRLIQRSGPVEPPPPIEPDYLYEYKLSLNDSSVDIPAEGGSAQIEVTSQRRKKFTNGTYSDWEDAAVTASFPAQPPFAAELKWIGVNKKIFQVTITSANITEEAMSATLVFKQDDEGGITIPATINQAKGEITYTYETYPEGFRLTVPLDQMGSAWEGSGGAQLEVYKVKRINTQELDRELISFKIPSIAETKMADNYGSDVKSYHWFTGYNHDGSTALDPGNIETDYMKSLIATFHIRTDPGGNSVMPRTAYWECVCEDGGVCSFSTTINY